ncbi:MAG TPA: NACHT domain-containing protein [Leptolyngbyaceae cyanobacterium]
MRLLSGEEIGVDQLYVDVWLLNRSPRTYQVSQDKLLQTFDLRNDRLGLGDRIKRNPGFEIANANAKLLILGKPGAGKTTFLKHLAVDWCKGQFQLDLIAVFIELRRIRDGEWKLLDAIGKELGLGNWEQVEKLLQQRKNSSLEEEQEKQIEEFRQQVKALLIQGNLLVLMDGLDEVPTNELRRKVQDQLREMANQYVNNRWILTCRTQIIASIPDGFASVEVADFSLEQVQQFVQNWFQASGHSSVEARQQWERFGNAISCNLALKELTVTPVLLSLMCLVFHDEGEIPSQMADLYERGIRLLLEKWNDTKSIEGWEIGGETYRQLSIERKKALLIEIAGRKFENPENFVLFQQEEIAAQIAKFICLHTIEEGAAALKAMEAQHGLLIERADGLWSFSHLTFQEHFTVQWLTQLSPAQLAGKLANSQWQEVVRQLMYTQQPADRLMRLIKRSIDQSISSEPTLNEFLTWVLQRAGSARTDAEPAALRAFYFALGRTLDLGRALDLALDLDLARYLALDLNRAHDLAHDLVLARHLDRAFNRARDLGRGLNLVHDRGRGLNLAHDLAHDLALVRTCVLDYELVVKLEQLETKLSLSKNWQHFRLWWQAQGQQWLEDLRQVMIKHRNIGHKWQFTKQQKQQLQRYYDANLFLVGLIQTEGAVSQEVQADIEDSLLLPWDELQCRYPEVYGSNSP